MRKAIVYGFGRFFDERRLWIPEDVDIVAYASSFEKESTTISGNTFEGKRILTPKEIWEYEYDLLIIGGDSGNAAYILDNIRNYNIPMSKVWFLHRAEQAMGICYKKWENITVDDDGNDGSLISKFDNILIREKYLCDSMVVSESFVENEYSVNIPKDTVVIDIGMNIGAATLFFAGNQNVSKVYGFEPFPDTYHQALDNIKLNTAEIQDKIQTFNVAVANENTEKECPILTEFSGGRSSQAEMLDSGRALRKTKLIYKEQKKYLKIFFLKTREGMLS